MKTIKMLVTAIGMAVLVTSSLFADGPTIPTSQLPEGCTSTEGYSITTGLPCDCNPGPIPDRLPLSMSDMQVLAWEKVANIGMWSWASSAIRASTNVKSDVWVGYHPTNGIVKIKDVFSAIRAQRLTLSVLYPSDEVELQTGLYDINGENLFYGYSWASINTPNQGVSSNRLSIVLEMNDQFLVPFPSATRFLIVERDGNGNPIRFYNSQDYDVQNGRIRIPGYFLDKSGEVRVTLCNGLEVAYSLSNRGRRIIPTTVQVEVTAVSVLGVRTFDAPTQVYNGVGLGHAYIGVSNEEFEKNINPLGQLIVRGRESSYISYAAWIWADGSGPDTGQVRENASAVKIWPYGELESAAEVLNIDNVTAQYRPPGTYWVKYVFASGWPHGNNQFSPPYEYNGGSSGGGGGSVTQSEP